MAQRFSVADLLPGDAAVVGDAGGRSRRLRAVVDEPAVRAAVVADVQVVVATGSSASSTQHLTVRQGRSGRTGPQDSNDCEEQP